MADHDDEVPDVLRLNRELEAMPERAALFRVKLFAEVVWPIFEGNARELLVVLAAHDDHRIWNMTKDGDRPRLHAMQAEVIRRLHNFLSSARSLEVHMRNLYRREYKPKGQLVTFEADVKREFADDPLTQFVKCLRQHADHFYPPGILSECDFSGSGASRVFLERSSLEQFEGWNAHAKEFMRQEGPKIDLHSVAVRYFAKQQRFYCRFMAQLEVVHETDWRRVEAKQDALRRADPVES